MSGKGLEVLKEVAPQVTRVAVMYKPDQAPQLGMWRAIEAVGPSLGVSVSAVSRTESEDFPSIVHENQIFVEVHWPAEGCDESRKNGG